MFLVLMLVRALQTEACVFNMLAVISRQSEARPGEARRGGRNVYACVRAGARISFFAGGLVTGDGVQPGSIICHWRRDYFQARFYHSPGSWD